jgi:molybdate transport system substrate-binding protein
MALAMSTTVAACRPSSTVEPLRVAAAADLTFAFRDMGAEFEKRHREKVVLSFGASGLLEKQIAEGAPFDVFAAGDITFVDDAIRSGACLADSKAVYAKGRIVLVGSARGKEGSLPRTLGDLADPAIGKIAIANPEHAPYGKAAKQALERAGVWERVRARLVYGENVQQTLEFVRSGNAGAAITALSLVTGTGSVEEGSWVEVPASLYDPIVQALIVCTRGKAGVPAAQKFVSFVQSNDGRAVLHRYGFLEP